MEPDDTRDAGDLHLRIRPGLPTDLRVLVRQIPPELWRDHPGFGGLTQFWLEKHAAFRQLLERIGADARMAAAGDLAELEFAQRLYRAASMLLGELHGHHSIEDAHYFPQLRQLEPSVARGFDLLESDHRDLDAELHALADTVNAVLRTAQAPSWDAGQAEVFAETVDGFAGLLERHLVDEEEIVIPALLKLSA